MKKHNFVFLISFFYYFRCFEFVLTDDVWVRDPKCKEQLVDPKLAINTPQTTPFHSRLLSFSSSPQTNKELVNHHPLLLLSLSFVHLPSPFPFSPFTSLIKFTTLTFSSQSHSSLHFITTSTNLTIPFFSFPTPVIFHALTVSSSNV